MSGGIDDSAGGTAFHGDLFAPNGTINIGGGTWTTFAEGNDISAPGGGFTGDGPLETGTGSSASRFRVAAAMMRPAAPETWRNRARRGALWLLAVGICLSGLELIHSVIQVNATRGLYDFRGGLFNAGVAILHGHSPYRPGSSPTRRRSCRPAASRVGETASNAVLDPGLSGLRQRAVVPLSLLPFWLAGDALHAALRRGDGRRHPAARRARLALLGPRADLLAVPVRPASSVPSGRSWSSAPGSPGAGVTALWPPALAIATIVGAKVFPWPLGVWLLITRRYKALALTVAAGVVLTFGAWALIGFDGLAQYPKMLSDISFLQEGRAVSVVAVLLVAGVPPGWPERSRSRWPARCCSPPGGSPAARTVTAGRSALVIIAALTATPIVWEHYMVLLLVPWRSSPRVCRSSGCCRCAPR